MGRNTTADKTPLLDNAEQNIGNSEYVYPQSGSAGVVIPQTNPQRIINLAGGSGAGQTTTVTMTVSRVLQGANNLNPGFPGPITGIIEFGNGGRFTKIEFDLVVGPFTGSFTQATSSIEPQDGIVMVTVPTSAIRAYARYDNLLVEPVLGTNPPMSHAQLSGVPVIGPGGPLLVTNTSPPPVNIVIPPEPVLVKAMAAYFTKTRSRTYKTLNLYLSTETNAPAPAAITVGTPSVAAIASFPKYNFWALPAFTKKVKVLRFPDTTALNVLLHDGVRPVDYIQIAGGSTAPEFEVIGNQCIIGITSDAGTVTMLKLVCEVGI